MRVVTAVDELRGAVLAYRADGQRIGFVPTMGYLHEGHLALVDESRRRTDRTVASIFVNPLQFGPSEDLSRYPRDLSRDTALLEARGVDLLYVPAETDMYPEPALVTVEPGALAAHWEGAVRPGHFRGVLTVVAKLFHRVAPDLACFGQKDIQQVTVVRRMVRDLDWAIELVVVPTVREADGLAMSSRNVYLKADQRRDALSLSRALRAVAQRFAEGVVGADALDQVARRTFAEYPAVVVDYVAIVDPDRLEPVVNAAPGTIVAVAARVGTTRLIDNLILGR